MHTHIIFLELNQSCHYIVIYIKIWQDLFQNYLIWQMKALQPFKTLQLYTSHVGVCIPGDLNPKI
jgi:hypothetical protein